MYVVNQFIFTYKEILINKSGPNFKKYTKIYFPVLDLLWSHQRTNIQGFEFSPCNKKILMASTIIHQGKGKKKLESQYTEREDVLLRELLS